MASSPPASPQQMTSLPPTPLGSTPVQAHLSSGRKRPRSSPRASLGMTPTQSPTQDSERIAPTPDQTNDFPKKQKADTKENLIQEHENVFPGTDIPILPLIAEFTEFLKTYRPRREEGTTEAVPYYLRVLMRVGQSNNGNGGALEVNCRHMNGHSPQLYARLIEFPQTLIGGMDIAARELYLEQVRKLEGREPEDDEGINITVRPFNLRQLHDARLLDPEHIETLVAITGMITRTSAIIPELQTAHYRCEICTNTVDVQVIQGRVDEPSSCPALGCRAKQAMRLIHSLCFYKDKQIVRIQENPDSMPEGHTPHGMTLFAYDSLVDAVRPGDRVEVTAIFRAIPRRVSPRVTTLRTLYKTYLEVIHYKIQGQERDDPFAEEVQRGATESIDDQENEHDENSSRDEPVLHEAAQSQDPRKRVFFSPERIAAFHAFADGSELLDDDENSGKSTYERLLSCMAPSIFGLEDVKRGVLCMLFGGVARERILRSSNENENTKKKKPALSRSRGDINILMCGDPGTSKSQLLGFVHRISPRGIYTSGKGSSAVGLTASINRDPETKELVMESGAVVLSDLGICAIDEFDKMSDATRAVLHEAMEQQTISLAKAGIVATLNARTSILASANPVNSRYDPKLSVVENIQLPPTLLSRFDLIYLILDQPDREADRRLAQHIVSLFLKDPVLPKAQVDERFVRDYIAYAKAKIDPEISDQARDELIEAYVKMRGGNSLRARRGKSITATPRQLEGMIRLSESLARMRLDANVQSHDVQEAVRLMQVATLAAATDKNTGMVDMGAIATGQSDSRRTNLLNLTNELKILIESSGIPRGTPTSLADMLEKLQAQSDVTIEQPLLLEAVQILVDDDIITHNTRAGTITRR